MGGRHADRLWLVAGLVAIALLGAGSWFGLINPQYTKVSEVQEQTDTANSQVTQLRKRIAALKKDKANLSKLKAELQSYQDALPNDPGGPALLRQLQASGTTYDVDVGNITVGSEADSAAVPGLKELSITLTLTGRASNLTTFLEQLQGGGQKRAVLIDSAGLGSAQGAVDDGKPADYAPDPALSINLTMRAFETPKTAANAPTVTTN
jgi:Tfp pilus assembly protein PilO